MRYNSAPLMTQSLNTHWLELAGTRGVRILAIVVVAIVLARVLKALTFRLVKLSKGPSRVALIREQQTRTMAGVLYSIGAILIVAVAALMILPELGFDVTPFAAAAAVGSLAFGFGAQSAVKDMINGFFIVFEDQYVVGDMVQVNGETGREEYLTLRRTVLRNAGGAIVTIPNSLVGPGGQHEPRLVASVRGCDRSLRRNGWTCPGHAGKSGGRFPRKLRLVRGAGGRPARPGRRITFAGWNGIAASSPNRTQPKR